MPSSSAAPEIMIALFDQQFCWQISRDEWDRRTNKWNGAGMLGIVLRGNLIDVS